MNGRRDDGRGQRSEERELRRGHPEDYQAGRRGERDWDEHGYERGPERPGLDARDTGRADWDEERDYEHPSRDFDRDRSFRSMEGDRDRRDYEMDRDFGRAARELDRARGPGRDFNRDRELDRRAREFDPERIARRPEYSPSGNYRALQDEPREERERPRRYGDRPRPTSMPYNTEPWGFGQYARDAGAEREPGGGRDFQRHGGDMGRSGPERGRYGTGTRGPSGQDTRESRRPVGRDFSFSERGARGGTGRVPEEDTRYGGTEPGGHGPGVENMAPPSVGYGTSPSRRDDHEMGHGGFLGSAWSSATPSRLETPTRPSSPGRGPKSYQRGDDRIRADLCDRLMQGWMDASEVDVKVKDGEVTLSGTVRSRDEKRAIEDLAEEVLGVTEVTNNIRINRAEGALRHQASQEPVQRPGADTGDDRGLHS